MTTPPAPIALSVVLPTLREGPNLYRLLPPLGAALDALGVGWEVLVVDGDSEDGTDRIVAANGPRFRYVREPAKGYGRAILRGVAEARGVYILTMDADMSHPVEVVATLWAARGKADIVIGSRYVPGGHANQPWARLMLSKVLNAFFRRGLSIPVRDMSSGFRLYRKSIFRDLNLEFTNFAILVEILLKAFGQGRLITEAPFTYQPRESGASHARILAFGRDYLRLFLRMWRYRNSIDFADYDWRAYDSPIWLQRHWQRTRHAIVTRFVPSFVETCDVGCGSSRILASLPHAVGVDLRRDKLAFMRKTNRRLSQGDGLALPFPDHSFDCVISSQVIEHIPEEHGRHLDELLRILRPGGILVLGTPDYGGWIWPIFEWLYGLFAPGGYADEHVTRYTRASLEQALTDRGCRVEECAFVCGAEMILRAKKG